MLELPFKYAEIPGRIFDDLGDGFEEGLDEDPVDGMMFDAEFDTATPIVFVVADFDEMKEGT